MSSGARIVAEGFAFTNEVRPDAKEEWLYVVAALFIGSGSPDSMAFDAFGDLCVTMIMSDHLLALTPEGDAPALPDDGNPQANAELAAHAEAGTLAMEVMARAHGTLAP